MKWSFVCCLVALAGWCGAQVVITPATRPASAATQPAASPSQIAALIKRLGDDNPRIRQEAGEALRKLGKTVLPALEDARKSEDPEVATRAQAVARQIEQDQKPATTARTPGGPGVLQLGNGNVHIQVAGGLVVNGNFAVTKIERNGVKDTTITEGNRTIKIREDDQGITLSVTETKEGKDHTQEWKAKDLDTLKKEHPEAAKIYDKYGRAGGMLQINLQGPGAGAAGGAVINIQPQP